jgi:pimeloyl-ACP methyl ester carboxylesterase
MTSVDRSLRTAIAVVAFGALVATGGLAMAGSLGGPLQLQDEGSFFVNGQLAASTHPGTAVGGISQPGTITVNQMYVQYRIPQTVRGPAIVMVHGSGHTGATYETTPDGREGWATYFARKGFPVYVVDHSGRGRSGFNPTAINRARAESNAALLPDLQIAPRERAWYFFRIGATYPTPFPGSQFPVEAFDHYTAQLVPNAEATLPGAGANTVQALGALLDKIGPAVVMVHSQSGAYGMDLVRARAIKMLGLINVEGNCAPVTPEEVVKIFARVPLLSVWGDNSQGAPGPNGDDRRQCREVRRRLRQVPAAARGRPQGQQPHADDGQEQPADRRPDHRLARRERAGALISCPGRVQRAHLRERNESRDPAQEARTPSRISGAKPVAWQRRHPARSQRTSRIGARPSACEQR